MRELPPKDSERTVSERFRGKPDIDEPWRYVCPECGKQVWKKKRGTSYECNSRHGPFDKAELRDKTQEEIHV